jgi:hypothetical protein
MLLVAERPLRDAVLGEHEMDGDFVDAAGSPDEFTASRVTFP